jgi:signal transduction histidine kinase
MTRMRLRAEFIQDDDQRQPWLRDIGELDRIADSAIGLVREEASDAKGERVSLNVLVAGLIVDLNDMGFDIHSTQLESVEISARPMALTRALRNLFINAATHGKGAQVRLARNAQGVLITIEDRGPGIPDYLIARVFEPFFRVDFARHQCVPGAGLGLAIAKEIIERYGGTIVLKNMLSGGLLQRIAFPANASEEST